MVKNQIKDIIEDTGIVKQKMKIMKMEMLIKFTLNIEKSIFKYKYKEIIYQSND